MESSFIEQLTETRLLLLLLVLLLLQLLYCSIEAIELVYGSIAPLQTRFAWPLTNQGRSGQLKPFADPASLLICALLRPRRRMTLLLLLLLPELTNECI